MDAFAGIEAFAAVVERGSFTAAAASLQTAKSSVSETVRALEERMGVRLLDRTTRQRRPTEAGPAFYRNCRRLIDDMARPATRRRLRTQPTGRLPWGCPTPSPSALSCPASSPSSPPIPPSRSTRSNSTAAVDPDRRRHRSRHPHRREARAASGGAPYRTPGGSCWSPRRAILQPPASRPGRATCWTTAWRLHPARLARHLAARQDDFLRAAALADAQLRGAAVGGARQARPRARSRLAGGRRPCRGPAHAPSGQS